MILGRDIVEQFTIAAMLHDQKESIFCFDNFVKLNDCRMAHNSQDVDLTSHSLDVVHIINFPLVEDLDCNFLTGKYVVALLNFSEGALAERLLNLIITNQSLTHIYDFLVDLSLDGHANLGIIHTTFELEQPIGNIS